MASDYEAIALEHRLDYGRKLTVWAQDHLANRYAERTHFIFELLQNAEDALLERGKSSLPTSVAFDLRTDGLEVRHYGKPFTPENVKSICAINESTKKDELTEIGRFGIGFKSVYAFTQRPEVHSGDEHFVIESFVLPVGVPERRAKTGETLFWIPFSASDTTAVTEVAAALRGLGSRRLLFLTAINEITWALPDGANGVFLKNPPVPSDDGQLITLLGEVSGGAKEEADWLIFSREVKDPTGRPAGLVAIAFWLNADAKGKQRVREVSDSRLVAFFPTDVRTATGFLMQGPYRTTPSRDNVPLNDKWNRELVDETADLLVDALRSLRDRQILDVDALNALPIDARVFGPDSIFYPLFDRVRDALKNESLLPTHQLTYVSGFQSRLARSDAVRELFSPSQLAQLLGVKPDLYWLSDEITKDRASTLREYLMAEVGVGEVTTESLQSRLSVAFLTVQSDDWMCEFYEFLASQKALLRELQRKQVAFIRCDDNMHVPPTINGQPQVFLPSQGVTGFKTVKRSVCNSPAILEFFREVGLSEPDPVDDVIQNVVKHYQSENVTRSSVQYESDIRRILAGFRTDSEQGRRKLVEALKQSYFVRTVDACSGTVRFAIPSQTYRSTQRLRAVFAGVSNVSLVDGKSAPLRGEPIRELLQACGAFDVIRAVPSEPSLSWDEKRSLRIQAGNESYSFESFENDADSPDLKPFLDVLAELSSGDAKTRSFEFWMLLADTLRDRREAYFQATYKWGYMRREFASSIPTSWVRRLQKGRWVMDASGQLKAPHELCFSDSSAEIQSAPNPFLVEVLKFRPEAIKLLAEQEGIDLEALNLLKRHKISAEKLRMLLGSEFEETDENTEVESSEVEDESIVNSASTESETVSGDTPDKSDGGESTASGEFGSDSPDIETTRKGRSDKRDGGTQQTREEFHTYVSVGHVEPSDDEQLESGVRRDLEEAAIKYILSRESQLQRTPLNNPGFDLFEGDEIEAPVRFVEVKARRGSWNGSVTLSEEQFRLAEMEQERYWLYVVEFADTPQERRLFRIQDPAGKTRYFSFDSGWKSLAAESP